MAAREAKSQKPEPGLIRQFVVRLPQARKGQPPQLYDRLLDLSLRRSREQGRRVAMTDIAREALEALLGS